jgi:hypothetical protein
MIITHCVEDWREERRRFHQRAIKMEGSSRTGKTETELMISVSTLMDRNPGSASSVEAPA